MEIGDIIEITVRRIANGVIARVERRNGYNVTQAPESYYSSLEEVEKALPDLMSDALDLVIDPNSGPDF